MKVEDCIADLLFENDCVIIPGFGGFVVNKTSAKIESSRKIIYPPSRKIAFNARLKDNDGLLINYVARINNELYPEAQKRVETFCDEMFETIEANKRPAIGRLGTFYIDTEGNLQFVADYNSNFSKHAFGLNPLHVVSLESEPEKEIIKIPQPMSQPQQKSGRHYKSKPEHTIQNQRKWLLTIPIAIILLMIWVYQNDFEWASSASHFQAQADYSAITNEAIAQRLAALDELNKKVKAALGNGRKQSSNPESIATEPPSVVSENASAGLGTDGAGTVEGNAASGSESVQETVYYVIAGQFSIEENANKYVEKLKQQGYASEIAGHRNQLTLVSCFVSGDKAEAKSKLREFQEQLDPDVWIYASSNKNR